MLNMLKLLKSPQAVNFGGLEGSAVELRESSASRLGRPCAYHKNKYLGPMLLLVDLDSLRLVILGRMHQNFLCLKGALLSVAMAAARRRFDDVPDFCPHMLHRPRLRCKRLAHVNELARTRRQLVLRGLDFLGKMALITPHTDTD